MCVHAGHRFDLLEWRGMRRGFKSLKCLSSVIGEDEKEKRGTLFVMK